MLEGEGIEKKIDFWAAYLTFSPFAESIINRLQAALFYKDILPFPSFGTETFCFVNIIYPPSRFKRAAKLYGRQIRLTKCTHLSSGIGTESNERRIAGCC